MEPINMLAAGTATLYATNVVEEAGGQAANGLSAATRRLVAWLRGTGREDTETGATLPMVVAAPTDQARIDLLARLLVAHANADPWFASERGNESVAPRRRGTCD